MNKMFFAWIVAIFLFTSTALADSVDKKTFDKGYRFAQDGWIVVHVEGKPFERGMQYGYLVAPEMQKYFKYLYNTTYEQYGVPFDFFVKQATQLYTRYVDPEYLAEIKGIAAGAQKAGVKISWQEILTLNSLEELLNYWWPMNKDKATPINPHGHCSAFIATGSATEKGDIVIAHNTWTNFMDGQFFNVALDIQPDKGHRMFMQTFPGFIDSGTDFLVTDAGLMITETSIEGYNQAPLKNGAPEFVRARHAAQYADSLDDFAKILLKNNNGGYPNSWLVGDRKTGEIMLFELGLKYHLLQKKKDGYFIGFNGANDPRIRNLEATDVGYYDVRTMVGARKVRLTQLMTEYYGKINTANAEKIMADHYDVYLQKENPSTRTIDSHFELDNGQYPMIGWIPYAYMPFGSLDGKVADSDLAKQMHFLGRWGNASGMPFDAKAFLKEHPQWSYFKDYLYDRPTQPWTNLGF